LSLCKEGLVSWCDGGLRVGLREHLVAVAEVLMGVERLWSPIRAADKAFSALIGRDGVVASAAVAAALLHDLGKAHEDFVKACAEKRSTRFPYHEVVGAYLLFMAGEEEGLDNVVRSAAYLASYAVLAHHHAMRDRGVEAVFGGGEPPDREFLLLPSVSGVVRGAFEEVAPLIEDSAEEWLVRALVESVVARVEEGARVSLRHAARVMRSVRVPGARVMSVGRVRAALFSNVPAAAYYGGNVVRRAGFTLAGVLAAADTLAASVERGSCSVFCLRLVRELVGG